MLIDSYHISIDNATDIGRVRELNEDYMAHFATPIGYCIVICDGMGGHAAGDVASQNAIAAIRMYLQDEKNTESRIPQILRDSIEFANYKLREMVQQTPSLKGMGTTCILALIKDDGMYVAHAGDSRLYLLRNRNIKQISKDHSTVQNLIDIGVLTEKEAEKSEKKNQITKALGIFEKVDPTVTEVPIPLMNNDKILLCSDGLTTHVSKRSINDTLLKIKDPQKAVNQLIDKANNGGGSDNTTVQIIHYTGNSSASIRKRKRLMQYAAATVLVVFVGAAATFGYLKFFSEKKDDISIKLKTQKNEVKQAATAPNSNNANRKKSFVTNTKEADNKDAKTVNDSIVTVKDGETLLSIAFKYHLTQSNLLELNHGLDIKNKIYPGNQIYIKRNVKHDQSQIKKDKNSEPISPVTKKIEHTPKQ